MKEELSYFLIQDTLDAESVHERELLLWSLGKFDRCVDTTAICFPVSSIQSEKHRMLSFFPYLHAKINNLLKSETCECFLISHLCAHSHVMQQKLFRYLCKTECKLWQRVCFWTCCTSNLSHWPAVAQQWYATTAFATDRRWFKGGFICSRAFYIRG